MIKFAMFNKTAFQKGTRLLVISGGFLYSIFTLPGFMMRECKPSFCLPVASLSILQCFTIN